MAPASDNPAAAVNEDDRDGAAAAVASAHTPDSAQQDIPVVHQHLAVDEDTSAVHPAFVDTPAVEAEHKILDLDLGLGAHQAEQEASGADVADASQLDRWGWEEVIVEADVMDVAVVNTLVQVDHREEVISEAAAAILLVLALVQASAAPGADLVQANHRDLAADQVYISVLAQQVQVELVPDYRFVQEQDETKLVEADEGMLGRSGPVEKIQEEGARRIVGRFRMDTGISGRAGDRHALHVDGQKRKKQERVIDLR